MELPAGTYNETYSKDMALVRTRWQWVLVILLLGILFVLIPLTANRFWLSMLTTVAITIVSVHGLNMLFGYCGLPSLGHFAFMAVGAYTATILGTRYDIPFWAAIPFAGVAAALVGSFFGLASLRIKGFYIAITTLAAQAIIAYLIMHLRPITGGVVGLPVATPSLGGIEFDSDRSFYFIPMVVAVVMTLFALNLARSRVGRAFVAIRDNDIAAQAMGIKVFRYKMLAFAIGCFFAGVAGSLLAYQFGYLSAESFVSGSALIQSVWLLGTLFIGGMGTTIGPILGVVFVQGLQQFASWAGPQISYAFPNTALSMQTAFSPLLFGLVLMLFLIFEPRGLAHRWRRLKASYRLFPFST